MLIRNNWREHLGWIAGIILIAAGCIYLHVSAIKETGWESRPSGSTGALFWFGFFGGLICAFEMLLWWRKRVRVWRIGAVKTWMRAHIWLGLLAVPLLVMHSGFYFKNLEATLLFALFLIVIASGIYGLILQQYIPQQLLSEVPVETIYSQIPHVANLLVIDARQFVVSTCGLPGSEAEEPAAYLEALREEKGLARAAVGDQFTVGKVREFGGSHGQLMTSRAVVEPVPNSEPLRHFFKSVLAGYLRDGKKSGAILANEAAAEKAFADLRLKLDPRTHVAVDELEKLADERRLLDRQASLHFKLHSWLWIHLPLSVALIILMIVHVVKTLQYLWPA